MQSYKEKLGAYEIFLFPFFFFKNLMEENMSLTVIAKKKKKRIFFRSDTTWIYKQYVES